MRKFQSFVKILNTVDANVWGMCILFFAFVLMALAGLLYWRGKGTEAMLLVTGATALTNGAFALMRGHAAPASQASPPASFQPAQAPPPAPGDDVVKP